MDDVYPSSDFLSILHEHGVPITLSSDSHQKEHLDFAFERALDAGIRAGYTEIAYIDEERKIRFQKIET